MATTTMQAFIGMLIRASADNQMVSVGLAPELVTMLCHRLIEPELRLPLTEVGELIQLLGAARASEANVTVAMNYTVAGDVVDMHSALASGARQIIDLNEQLDACKTMISEMSGQIAAMEKAGA